MGWEEEYREAREKEEKSTHDYVEALEAKIKELEAEARRRHRRAVIRTYLAFIVVAVIVYEVWHYSHH